MLKGQTFSINGREIGADKPPYIIAEISANHNGSLQRALDTIDQAYQAGADAVKIQTYTADTLTIDCDKPDFFIRGGLWGGSKLYDLYKWAETPYEWHRAIFDHACSRGITVFSTPFDVTAVDLLEELNTPAYKIASFELVDLDLIRYVARTGKPIILSTGMANELEIEEAISAARDEGCKNLSLMHCISGYPTPIEQSNLRQIQDIKKRFKVVTGLSDHTLGTVASIAAVALGACLIEKHFTLSRAERGPDSDFSLEPAELGRLCSDARDAWLSLGKGEFERQMSEDSSRFFRRSIYFIKDLPAEKVVTSEDIRCIRPGKGLKPKYFDLLLGKRIKTSVTRGTATSWDLFYD